MSLDAFVVNGYVLSAAFLLFGCLFIWLGLQAGNIEKPSQKAKIKLLVSWRLFFTAMGFFYLFMSFLQVYVTFGSMLVIGMEAPCENVLANQTVAGNLTVYEYENSCSARLVPDTTETIFKIFSWSFGFMMLFLLIMLFAWMLVGVFNY